ncbi:MAG: hypothetical protein NVS3B16_23930 [Vulcanimicrobiaceae bacterium]
MPPRALGCFALIFASLLGPASAATAIHAQSGVEVIVFERDAAAPAPASKAHLARRTTVAYRPATALRHPNVVLPAAAHLRGASDLIATALAFVGTPYVWGGAAPGGFDCSGFTYYTFARLGIRIPRTADTQFAAGIPVAGDPLPGDLVFFQTYDYGASHVGIYLGDGRFVNSIGDNVHVATFGSTYFRSRYIGARRFLST